MHDNSRQFLDLPKLVSWNELIDSLNTLGNTNVKKLIPDHINGSWLDFSFNSYEFSVNEQLGRYWFFVNDPSCPEEVLKQIALHFKEI